jgi:hypothetical protein
LRTCSSRRPLETRAPRVKRTRRRRKGSRDSAVACGSRILQRATRSAAAGWCGGKPRRNPVDRAIVFACRSRRDSAVSRRVKRRQVADVVLVDPQRELVRHRLGVKTSRRLMGPVDQRLRYTMARQVIEADVLERPAQIATLPFGWTRHRRRDGGRHRSAGSRRRSSAPEPDKSQCAPSFGIAASRESCSGRTILGATLTCALACLPGAGAEAGIT